MNAFMKAAVEGLCKYLWADRILLGCANALARLIKPDPRLVLFGAMTGKWYGDNSRHLFEWAVRNRPDWRPVWVTRNRAVVQSLREQQLPVADVRSFKGLCLLFRAQRGAFTNSLRDIAWIPYLIPDRFRLVALRHGRSVKKVRYAREADRISPREARERKRETACIAYAASTSEFISDLQEQCLLIGREKHRVTGYPRNDALIRKSKDLSKPQLREAFPDRVADRVILYAPSWRHGREPTRFFPFNDFDPKALQDVLEEQGCLLLLRPHRGDLENYPEQAAFLKQLCDQNPRIVQATHWTFPDVNSLLPEVDALLTDYSALYHDFLLLDRPIGFIPYDYESFKQLNGFLYAYLEHLPGARLTTAEELLQWIRHPDSETLTRKRQALRDLIHTHQTPDACEKVAALLDSLVKPELG